MESEKEVIAAKSENSYFLKYIFIAFSAFMVYNPKNLRQPRGLLSHI